MVRQAHHERLNLSRLKLIAHLAYASYYKIDFLLTWNCNHLANANKKQHIRIINTRLNLPTPETITPLELFTETNHDN